MSENMGWSLDFDFKSKLESIEALIRNSDWKKAELVLLEVKSREVPSEYLAPLAALARRSGSPEIGLSFLRNLVRPTGKVFKEPTDEQIAEYAACLVMLGIFREAEELLSKVNCDKYPETYRHLANLHVKQWDNSKAIPFLEKYLASSELSNYQRIIGNLNLAQCFLFEEKHEATSSILNDTLVLTDKENTRLLKGNALRLLGLLEYQRGNYDFAIHPLQKALRTFADPNSLDGFLTRKWIGLCKYAIEKDNGIASGECKALLEEAKKIRHWESIRDIEFQKALIDKDEDKLTELYFLTPYKGFKDRLLKKAPYLKLPLQYVWKMGPVEKSSFSFDLTSSTLKPGQAPFRILRALMGEGYRPLSAQDLFEKVYSGSYYIKHYSEQRIYQAMKRLREWLEAEKIPLSIKVEDGSYKLISEVGIGIILFREEAPSSPTEFRLRELGRVFPEEFSIGEACQVLSVARRRGNEILRELIENEKIEVTGKASRTRYRVKKAA